MSLKKVEKLPNKRRIRVFLSSKMDAMNYSRECKLSKKFSFVFAQKQKWIREMEKKRRRDRHVRIVTIL